jgi:LysR family cyn operon transcriptional activator
MMLRQLQYFLDLAETEHLTKSASNLFVTQSTISHGITQLEKELGIALFERIGRGLVISQAGIKFKAYASRALQEIASGKMELSQLSDLQTGSLTIGVIPTFLDSLIPPAVAKFNQTYPGIKLSIRDLRADLIEEQLIAGELDIGIAFHPTHRQEIQTEHLFNERLVLLVSKKHTLRKTTSLDMAKLNNLALCLLPKSFSTRRLIDDCFMQIKIKPKVVVEIESVSSLIESCLYGNLATIIPERAAPKNKVFHMIHLQNPMPIRKAGILIRKGSSSSKAANAFIKIVKSAI